MRHFLLALLFLSGSTALPAQWRVALVSGTATSHGEARADSDPDHPELHADRPVTWTLSVAHDPGVWRVALDIHRTSANLAEIGTSSSVTTTSVLAAWGAGVEIARRIAGEIRTPSVLVGLGGTVNRWTFDLADGSPRTRIAGRGALEADLPISSRWSAVIRGELVAGSSVFKAEELPEGFSRRIATRLGVVLGVARAF